MRHLALLGLVAIGCRGSSSSSTSGIALVEVRFGDHATGGVTVFSHDDRGRVLESTTTDGSGLASVGIDDGGRVTVVLQETPTHLVTTTVANGGEITIVAPPAPPSPLVVGTLRVVPPAPVAGADHFDIVLGATTIRAATLPATVDVIASCLGTDANLDVLVRAVGTSGVLAYAAGRVPLVADAADFLPVAWSTAIAAIPMSVTGFTPTSVAWSVFSDGEPMYSAPQPGVPTGLVVDRAQLQVGVPGAQTTVVYAGAPPQITLGPDDILAPLAGTVAIDGTRFSWTAPKLGDVIDLAARWPNLAWDAALAPTADHVALPGLDGLDTSGALTATLHAIDSSELDGAPAELHTDTIVPLPAAGTVRDAETANGAARAPHAH